MGLVVLPVFAEDDSNRIDYMQVSVALPRAVTKKPAEYAAGTSVAAPVSGAGVVRSVGPAKDGCMNVVDFPSKLRQLAVLAPLDEPAVAVHPHVGEPDGGGGF